MISLQLRTVMLCRWCHDVVEAHGSRMMIKLSWRAGWVIRNRLHVTTWVSYRRVPLLGQVEGDSFCVGVCVFVCFLSTTKAEKNHCLRRFTGSIACFILSLLYTVILYTRCVNVNIWKKKNSYLPFPENFGWGFVIGHTSGFYLCAGV